MAEAEATELNDAAAVALATVDSAGMPNVRMVLLKRVSEDGLQFFTNHGSAKARELQDTGKAALVMHWKSLRRQIRVRGRVERQDGPETDAYFKSRSPGSRYGAWASRQSQILGSREEMEHRLRDVRTRLGPDPHRPEFWGGYRLLPSEVEFWSDAPDRLHDRFLWRRAEGGSGWIVQRLWP